MKEPLQPLPFRSHIKLPQKYTHTDALGIRWRYVGSRPVSELADRVMRECGLEPKPKRKTKKGKVKHG